MVPEARDSNGRPPPAAPPTPYANAGQAPHSLVAGRNGDERPATARTFAAQVTPVAEPLIIAGPEPVGRIAIMPRTRYEWAGPDLAVRAAGGGTVPNDAHSSPNRSEWIVRGSGARHLIAESAEHAEAVATGRAHAE
ncbi:AMP-binding protein [Streptomyces sp. NPDC002402]